MIYPDSQAGEIPTIPSAGIPSCVHSPFPMAQPRLVTAPTSILSHGMQITISGQSLGFRDPEHCTEHRPAQHLLHLASTLPSREAQPAAARGPSAVPSVVQAVIDSIDSEPDTRLDLVDASHTPAFWDGNNPPAPPPPQRDSTAIAAFPHDQQRLNSAAVPYTHASITAYDIQEKDRCWRTGGEDYPAAQMVLFEMPSVDGEAGESSAEGRSQRIASHDRPHAASGSKSATKRATLSPSEAPAEAPVKLCMATLTTHLQDDTPGWPRTLPATADAPTADAPKAPELRVPATAEAAGTIDVAAGWVPSGGFTSGYGENFEAAPAQPLGTRGSRDLQLPLPPPPGMSAAHRVHAQAEQTFTRAVPATQDLLPFPRLSSRPQPQYPPSRGGSIRTAAEPLYRTQSAGNPPARALPTSSPEVLMPPLAAGGPTQAVLEGCLHGRRAAAAKSLSMSSSRSVDDGAPLPAALSHSQPLSQPQEMMAGAALPTAPGSRLSGRWRSAPSGSAGVVAVPAGGTAGNMTAVEGTARGVVTVEGLHQVTARELCRRSSLAGLYCRLLGIRSTAVANDPVLFELSRLTDDLLVPDHLLARARSLRDVSNATLNMSRSPHAEEGQGDRVVMAATAGSGLERGANSGSGAGYSGQMAAGAGGSGAGATGQRWRGQELSRLQLMTLLRTLTSTPPSSETDRPGGGGESRSAHGGPRTSEVARAATGAGAATAVGLDTSRGPGGCTDLGRVVLLGVDLSGQRQLDDQVLERGLLEGLTAHGRGRVRLRHLGLARCSLTASSLLGLGLCPPLALTLRHLDLSGNPGVTWDEPAWRWALMGCTALQSINVKNTGLDTAALIAFTDMLYDLVGVRQSLAVLQAGPPTDLRRRQPSSSAGDPRVGVPGIGSCAAASPHCVPAAITSSPDLGRGSGPGAMSPQRSGVRGGGRGADGGDSAGGASYGWLLLDAELQQLKQRLAALPALQVVELVGTSTAQIDELFATLLARPTLMSKFPSTAHVEWIAPDTPRICLTSGRLSHALDRELPPGLSVTRGYMHTHTEQGQAAPAIVAAAAGALLHCGKRHVAAAGHNAATLASDGYRADRLHAGEISGGYCAVQHRASGQVGERRTWSASAPGVVAGVVLPRTGSGAAHSVDKASRRQQQHHHHHKEDRRPAGAMGSRGGGSSGGRLVQLGMAQFATRLVDGAGSVRAPGAAAVMRRPQAARRGNQEEDERWGMGSTEDDSDEYEHAGRRVTGKLSTAVNSGSGNGLQPRRTSGKTEAVSRQWWTSDKRQQQQQQRPKQRSLDELLPLVPKRCSGGGSASRSAEMVRRPDKVITNSSNKDNTFRPTGRRNGNQRWAKYDTKTLVDSDDGLERLQYDEDEDEDDVLYGRRGGAGRRNLYDSVYEHANGTGYYDSDDLDGDLEGFIDDNVRMSTSEDDDEELRGRHQREARKYDKFELEKEFATLLPALRREHRHFGAPSSHLASDRRPAAKRPRSQSESRSRSKSDTHSPAVVAARRSTSPHCVSVSRRSRGAGGRPPHNVGVGLRSGRTASGARGGGGDGAGIGRDGDLGLSGDDSRKRRKRQLQRNALDAGERTHPRSTHLQQADFRESSHSERRRQVARAGAGAEAQPLPYQATSSAGGNSRRRRDGIEDAAELLDLLQNATKNPELRNLMPYAWDRRIALHPFNMNQMYALGRRRSRLRTSLGQRYEEVFNPTGRYALLAEKLKHGEDEEEDNISVVTAATTPTAQTATPLASPGAVSTGSGAAAASTAAAGAIEMEATAKLAPAVEAGAGGGAPLPSTRAARELRLLEPFGWDRYRMKHPANLDLLGIPRATRRTAAGLVPPPSAGRPPHPRSEEYARGRADALAGGIKSGAVGGGGSAAIRSTTPLASDSDSAGAGRVVPPSGTVDSRSNAAAAGASSRHGITSAAGLLGHSLQQQGQGGVSRPSASMATATGALDRLEDVGIVLMPTASTGTMTHVMGANSGDGDVGPWQRLALGSVGYGTPSGNPTTGTTSAVTNAVEGDDEEDPEDVAMRSGFRLGGRRRAGSSSASLRRRRAVVLEGSSPEIRPPLNREIAAGESGGSREAVAVVPMRDLDAPGSLRDGGSGEVMPVDVDVRETGRTEGGSNRAGEGCEGGSSAGGGIGDMTSGPDLRSASVTRGPVGLQGVLSHRSCSQETSAGPLSEDPGGATAARRLHDYNETYDGPEGVLQNLRHEADVLREALQRRRALRAQQAGLQGPQAHLDPGPPEPAVEPGLQAESAVDVRPLAAADEAAFAVAPLLPSLADTAALQSTPPGQSPSQPQLALAQTAIESAMGRPQQQQQPPQEHQQRQEQQQLERQLQQELPAAMPTGPLVQGKDREVENQTVQVDAEGKEDSEGKEEAEIQRQLRAVLLRVQRAERALRQIRPWDWDELKSVHPPNVDKLAPAKTKRQHRAPVHYSPTKVEKEEKKRRGRNGCSSGAGRGTAVGGDDGWEVYDPAALSPVIRAAGQVPSNRSSGSKRVSVDDRACGSGNGRRKRREGEDGSWRQRQQPVSKRKRVSGKGLQANSGSGSSSSSSSMGGSENDDGRSDDLPIGRIAAAAAAIPRRTLDSAIAGSVSPPGVTYVHNEKLFSHIQVQQPPSPPRQQRESVLHPAAATAPSLLITSDVRPSVDTAATVAPPPEAVGAAVCALLGPSTVAITAAAPLLNADAPITESPPGIQGLAVQSAAVERAVISAPGPPAPLPTDQLRAPPPGPPAPLPAPASCRGPTATDLFAEVRHRPEWPSLYLSPLAAPDGARYDDGSGFGAMAVEGRVQSFTPPPVAAGRSDGAGDDGSRRSDALPQQGKPVEVEEPGASSGGPQRQLTCGTQLPSEVYRPMPRDMEACGAEGSALVATGARFAASSLTKPVEGEGLRSSGRSLGGSWVTAVASIFASMHQEAHGSRPSSVEHGVQSRLVDTGHAATFLRPLDRAKVTVDVAEQGAGDSEASFMPETVIPLLYTTEKPSELPLPANAVVQHKARDVAAIAKAAVFATPAEVVVPPVAGAGRSESKRSEAASITPLSAALPGSNGNLGETDMLKSPGLDGGDSSGSDGEDIDAVVTQMALQFQERNT